MAEIGVHLKHIIVALGQSPLEPGDIRRAQSKFSLALHEVEPIGKLRSLQVFHDLRRAVGRAVVDNQNVKPVGQLHHGADNRLHVFLLVIGGDNDNAVASVHGCAKI